MNQQDHIDSPSILPRISLDLINQMADAQSSDQLIQGVLPDLLPKISAQAGGLVRWEDGRWKTQCWIGPQLELPTSLITDALDTREPILRDHWLLADVTAEKSVSGFSPLNVRPATALAVKLESSGTHGTSTLHPGTLTWIASSLRQAIRTVEHHQNQNRRIKQLEIVLAASAEWLQIDDDETLLRHLADTATELVGCERASIFLWQKRRKKLVGRPALGIEGSSLEIADDAGVVGEVLGSGEPKIWNAGSDDESRVNRTVDKQLEFQTHSLVAVPMRGQRGEIIGVFEAINHHQQSFGGEDAEVLSDLALHAAVAIEAAGARRKLTESRDRLVRDAASEVQLIGDHPDVQVVRESANKVAKTDLSVLVLGQNGTGKEVLARHLHFQSDRRNGPFIAVNCAALVESLLESELFGHERGAFTDANQTRVGKFELASGGTLFLDEVGDMSPGGQAKLLRVLEEKVVVRVGGSQAIPVDVRVIAATNQPLEKLIAEKKFREDLFFRLNVVSLTLPPLSARGNDVLLLAEHFLSHFSYQIGRAMPQLTDSAKTALLSHSWPGNVRELRNTIERVCYLSSDDQISSRDLDLSASPGARLAGNAHSAVPPSHMTMPVELAESTRLFQIAHIRSAIDSCNGNMTDAAGRLGLHRSNLYRKMRQLGMNTSGGSIPDPAMP